MRHHDTGGVLRSGSLASRLADHGDVLGARFLGSPPESLSQILRDRWNELCRRVALSGEVEELHAASGDLLNVFDRYISICKSHLALAETVDPFNGRDQHRHELRTELASTTDELIRLRDEVFGPWLTRDDRAEKLVESFPLSNDQLKIAAERFPAPQAWYEQTNDPFEPPVLSTS